ncbi:tRNA pseudouridine synthase D [Wallemia mellicola CBS 633.66]|nr:tRNA pseudouridine synthase D [Wallemia mellicola CBS 633.66]TIB93172.1 tRNA pseudouridine synthase D [Wallemia mellicola]EIM20393.1 tRNA pseudouridine synthase D [Wallemia mellicola CBS 633.66]TIB99617.1 tRNA pseudouridine synthase D [Wallemia mellicola]TIC05973.1 tRNA pseudouridine synthase D [Wallemia mellicola]TIC29520.1 tRNA pseudouridine synthase D [Wallemia mellicola]|eukprot:XP_006959649.1 tRNA pseudouridine synthase D [Wallemia mellicola CBS 633.66]
MDKNVSAVSGIIKHRFTDFFVNEIDKKDNVVRLTDIGLPEDELVESREKARLEAEKLDVKSWPEDATERLTPKLGPTVTEKIKELTLKGPSDEIVMTNPLGDDKEARKEVHDLLRAVLGGRFETSSTQSSEISIKWCRGGRPRREQHPYDKEKPYIHFVLQKSNRDSSDAVNHLSRMIKVKDKLMNVAGTKDKRGITTQRLCIKRGNMTLQDVWKRVNNAGTENQKEKKKVRRTIQEALQERGERGCRIGNLTYESENFALGDLNGNRFGIILRDVESDGEDTINASLKVLAERGFINYFGMQRFGTSVIPTHYIGWLLLNSDWEGACDSILRLRPNEDDDCVKGRKAWLDDKNGKEALKLLPRKMVAERAIIEHLHKSNRDFLGALSRIPRNLRTMYVHAYQSYIWNSVVSERMRTFGLKVVAGDVVSAGEDVKRVEEGEEDKYSIYDVLMPLPGHGVLYPTGKLGEKYKEMLEMDHLDYQKLWRPQKEFSMEGGYRKIVHLPKDVTWSVIQYASDDEQLLKSAEEELLGLDLETVEGERKHTAVSMAFNLGSSTYATMLLREVLKGNEKRNHS